MSSASGQTTTHPASPPSILRAGDVMSDDTITVALFGSNGFVGKAVAEALTAQGVPVRRISTPRLPPMSAAKIEGFLESQERQIKTLCSQIGSVRAVINAAGIAAAADNDYLSLTAANAALPALLASACREARVERFIHVSSAAVQGPTPMLDESGDTYAFSPYSKSKAQGEALALAHGPKQTVIYRPGGVHGPQRRITHDLARFARSRWASVAGDGTAHTPQALIGNVADAIAYLALTGTQPPSIVIHPSEHLTVEQLLISLGGRRPRKIPHPLARLITYSIRTFAPLDARASAITRRLETLWFGQEQATSWLEMQGWTAPLPLDTWTHLGKELQVD